MINADQAMKDGGIINISVKNHQANALSEKNAQKYILIQIKDQGRGIDVKHKDRIFEPYYTTKSAGTGLGLSICYSIIHKHDGSIEFDSEIGKGTTFKILIPVD